MLTRNVGTVVKKIHTPDCWFHEKPMPISVLETVGLSWDEVQARCKANGKLPVGDVLWLLNVLRTTKQVMSTENYRGNEPLGDLLSLPPAQILSVPGRSTPLRRMHLRFKFP